MIGGVVRVEIDGDGDGTGMGVGMGSGLIALMVMGMGGWSNRMHHSFDSDLCVRPRARMCAYA